MKVVKDAEDAEALVEIEVVEVVRLVGGEERKVVVGVRVDAVHGDEGAPQPHLREKHKQRPSKWPLLLCELAPAARGSQDAGSRNLGQSTKGKRGKISSYQ